MNNSQPEDFASDVFDGEPEVRRLFEQTQPTAPAVDIESFSAPQDAGPILPDRRNWFTSRGFLTMGGLIACAATVFAIVWLRPTDTFAQVQEVVAATKSVRYTSRLLGETAKHGLRMAESMLTESKARQKKTEENLKSTTDEEERKQLEKELSSAKDTIKQVEDYLAKWGDTAPVSRFFILGRYRQRQERTGIFGDMIDITNMKTGKTVSIEPRLKTVTIFTKQTVIHRDGKQTETEIKQTPDLTVDFYSQIRNIPKTAKKLSETKTIKGRKHIGFRTSKKDDAYTWTRTYWVDEETKLPRQIDFSARSEDKFYGPSDSVIEDIEFDVPLDEALFSTETPEGYSVKEAGLMGIE